jgi:hypothetical protein
MISSNTNGISIHNFMFVVNTVIGIGSNSAISTSKITAIRKIRDENGSHTEFFGSHPHSYGDISSWSSLFFYEIKVAKIIMAIDSGMVLLL